MFFYADTEDELLDTLDEILARLESVGLFAAAHKCTFSPVRSCGVVRCTHRGVCRMIPYGRVLRGGRNVLLKTALFLPPRGRRAG